MTWPCQAEQAPELPQHSPQGRCIGAHSGQPQPRCLAEPSPR